MTDCPNNQSQGSCFYMTSSVVVAVAQTLDPIDVVLEIIENSMSPMSDFVKAMEDNYAEKVTFGGQGIYERSVVPQAVVQGDEVRTFFCKFVSDIQYNSSTLKQNLHMFHFLFVYMKGRWNGCGNFDTHCYCGRIAFICNIDQHCCLQDA